ncbi:heparinase II/III family protein [Aliiglaciecola sp. SL4]|uniref:heparinase II/III domain-containing protein n=1 Tax=Aliiglaciecola sp. SL4 TaxID=3239806 RepID=UPI00355BFAA2
MLITKNKKPWLHSLTQVLSIKNVLMVSICSLSFNALSFASPSDTTEIERPSIWVKNSERAAILEKIQSEPWAKSLFEELKHRADSVAVVGNKKRRNSLEELPLVWSNNKSLPPTLPTFRHKDGGSQAQLTQVVKTLQDGVDCGVLYYLTQESKYATCGADILFTYINALKQMKVYKNGAMNSGWMFPTDHLYEARVIGAQLPIIYDFVYPYLMSGGKVYDLASSKLTDFNFNAAQNVFGTYVWLALNKGLLDSNWPVLESSSLVHNILALDDSQQIKKYIPYYTHIDTTNQASLNTVAKHFVNEGDIWPESFQYSRHVAGFSVYLMTLLDRYDPSLKLGAKYPNIPGAFTSYYNLEYPNDESPYIGDGHRTYKIDYADLENSLLLAMLNNNVQQQEYFTTYLSSSIKSGLYDRGHLHNRSYGASPYFTPLQLLWSVNKIQSETDIDVTPERPRTLRLEYAGMNIQRNINKLNPIKNSLMAFVAGGSYIHGHASGMDMELYGQGHVLGVDGGKGTYRTDIHENYYRLFAAHNTVISNGASASKGDWINLGINRVKSELMEPAAGDVGVSPKHSFSTSSFFDEFNLKAPAQHERTLALIKLDENKGYYLDIFRAKSNTSNQYHDYVYHNIGDELTITSNKQAVKLAADPDRYQDSAKLPWITTGQRGYRHPGWHFFDDVKTKSSSAQQYEATFTASKLGDKNISMRALIPAGLDIEISQVKAPKAYGGSVPYNKKPLPTFLLRHRGEAWTNPYAVAYESITEGEPYAVQTVERILANDVFKGVKVGIKLNGKTLTQYILIQESSEDLYQNKNIGINFKGRFAIVTLDEQQQLLDLYLGNGSYVQYKQHKVSAKPSTNSAYKRF